MIIRVLNICGILGNVIVNGAVTSMQSSSDEFNKVDIWLQTWQITQNKGRTTSNTTNSTYTK